MRRLWFRLRAMLRRMLDGDSSRDELSEEIQAFVERDIESKIQAGMSPRDARRAALTELGAADQVKERVWESAAGARWEGIFRDIRYAVRSLGQARTFSLSVIGSLSLGLAATIMGFALINGALLRSFPGVQDQNRLVALGILENTPFGPRVLRTALAHYPDVIRTLGDGMSSLQNLIGFTESDVAVSLPGPRSLQAAFVSPNYFDALGVRPQIGRAFVAEEGLTESGVAILGHALWTREYGRDPSVIGRSIRVGQQPFEIIGVAPPEFAGTTQNPIETGTELWLPIAALGLVAKNNPLDYGSYAIRYVGRMRDGVQLERVETELGVVAARLGVARPVDNPAAGRLVTSADATEPVSVEVSGLSRLDERASILLTAFILPVPLLVLAISCVNAANLFLVRASRRRRELAVRLALGASRFRIVWQLLIESLLLAAGAALLALPLAWWGVGLLESFLVFPIPLDGIVIAGALATSVLTALAFGLVPALQATGRHSPAALGTSPAASGGTRSQSRGRRALVAGQVALSLGVLATSFQLTSSLGALSSARGTDPDRLLLASFDLAQLHFSSAESDAFYTALLERAARLPGVEAAGMSSRNFGRSWGLDAANAVELDVGGEVSGSGGFSVWQSASAGGDYFDAVGLDLLQGREFAATDRRDTPNVAIVSDHLASQLFNSAALGRSLLVSTPFAGSTDAEVQIVGIVESPVTGLSGAGVAAIFFPSPFRSPSQDGSARTLHIRSAGPTASLLAPDVRDLVGQLNPEVPIQELVTLEEHIRADVQFARVLAIVAMLLGIVALLLASIGLYGVTSYSVAMRAREIAVRMALGARPNSVLAMVLRQALTLALIGSVIGAVAAVVAGLLVRAQVFGVAGIDVALISGSAALLALAMVLASLLPARRAARLAPYAVLREE